MTLYRWEDKVFDFDFSPKQKGSAMEVKYPDVEVTLTGTDGNAFSIIGKVAKALRRAGHKDAVEEFTAEAMSGDYDHVLQTAMAYVVVD